MEVRTIFFLNRYSYAESVFARLADLWRRTCFLADLNVFVGAGFTGLESIDLHRQALTVIDLVPIEFHFLFVHEQVPSVRIFLPGRYPSRRQ